MQIYSICKGNLCTVAYFSCSWELKNGGGDEKCSPSLSLSLTHTHTHTHTLSHALSNNYQTWSTSIIVKVVKKERSGVNNIELS